MYLGISYPPIPIVEVGPLALSLHGVFAALGFAAGAWLLLRLAGESGYPAEKISSVLTWALVGAILGARLFTLPAHVGDPGFRLIDAIGPAGPFSILGGFAGGVIAGGIRVRMLGLPFLALADLAAPGMALGTVVGRLGDLAIVEHLGRATDFFLGYAVRPGYDLAPQHNPLECVGQAVCGTYHHTALYDMLGAALLLWVLWRLRHRWRRRYQGQLFAFWMFWYGYQRFLVDFTRIGGVNADRMAGPLTWSQWSALGIGIGGMVLIWWLEGRTPPVGEEVPKRATLEGREG
ncbi:MAG: prolipoprotein diacylglyceryl transferase [Actinomycetota bacterium]|nr:prolipoprotein diacylglyceryl transferase [Actinomycetota bacterium]